MVTGIITQPILRQNKVTLYRLHPTEFGRVMIMPNLPNGLHEAEAYRQKGYKRTPQELNPDAKLEKNPEGELFLVPKGYALQSTEEMVEVDARTAKKEPRLLWRVTRIQDEASPKEGEPCPECGKICASKLGLISHLKSHKKK